MFSYDLEPIFLDGVHYLPVDVMPVLFLEESLDSSPEEYLHIDQSCNPNLSFQILQTFSVFFEAIPV